jgi:hypothetical protein
VKRTLCIAFIAGLSVVGCAGGPNPIPDAGSAAAALYTKKCGACHAVPHPKRNTATEWKHLFALMEQRMAERKMSPFSAEERETLLNYLQSNAR